MNPSFFVSSLSLPPLLSLPFPSLPLPLPLLAAIRRKKTWRGKQQILFGGFNDRKSRRMTTNAKKTWQQLFQKKKRRRKKVKQSQHPETKAKVGRLSSDFGGFGWSVKARPRPCSFFLFQKQLAREKNTIERRRKSREREREQREGVYGCGRQ